MPIPSDLANSSYTVKQDTWNRPEEFKNGSKVVATYTYDGLNRRISKSGASIPTHHDYYSQHWQVLEVRVTDDTGSTYEQNIWLSHKVEALASIWYDLCADW